MISEFPLFVFTTLAGLSAGAYVASAAFPVGGRENAGVALAGKAGGLGGPDGVGAAGAVGADARGARPWLFPLVCLALLGLGLVGCLGHLARPALFLNALVNPRAGIAQEAYLSIAYGVLLLVECIVVLRGKKSSRILSLACAVAAVGLTVVMGMAYLANLGTPAWVSWATVPLFVLGDALMGFALYALFSGWAYRKTAFFGIFMAIAVLFAVSLAFEANHFFDTHHSAIPFLVAIAIVAVAAAAALATRRRGGKVMPVATFVCVFMGVCIARWAFYSASVV